MPRRRSSAKAIATLEEAIGLAQASGDMPLVEELRNQRELVSERALNETTKQRVTNGPPGSLCC